MPEAKSVATIQEPTKTVICPQTDVVASAAPAIRSQMREAVSQGARNIEVDLVHVRMVDSVGIGLLIAAHNSLTKVGGRLAVVHASKDVLELFHMMNIHQHFSVSGN
jgi:anti-anti-sigma factor